MGAIHKRSQSWNRFLLSIDYPVTLNIICIIILGLFAVRHNFVFGHTQANLLGAPDELIRIFGVARIRLLVVILPSMDNHICCNGLESSVGLSFLNEFGF